MTENFWAAEIEAAEMVDWLQMTVSNDPEAVWVWLGLPRRWGIGWWDVKAAIIRMIFNGYRPLSGDRQQQVVKKSLPSERRAA